MFDILRRILIALQLYIEAFNKQEPHQLILSQIEIEKLLEVVESGPTYCIF